MIREFVTKFEESRTVLQDHFAKGHPESYDELVSAVISALSDEDYYDYGHNPDPTRITAIDHGDYQGTLVYVIGATGYQSSAYWSVFVSYGSCSGCDTLQDIRYDEGSFADPPNAKQIQAYMTLALHIVQGLKLMNQPDED